MRSHSWWWGSKDDLEVFLQRWALGGLGKEKSTANPAGHQDKTTRLLQQAAKQQQQP
jgi:hypothetical protein